MQHRLSTRRRKVHKKHPVLHPRHAEIQAHPRQPYTAVRQTKVDHQRAVAQPQKPTGSPENQHMKHPPYSLPCDQGPFHNLFRHIRSPPAPPLPGIRSQHHRHHTYVTLDLSVHSMYSLPWDHRRTINEESKKKTDLSERSVMKQYVLFPLSSRCGAPAIVPTWPVSVQIPIFTLRSCSSLPLTVSHPTTILMEFTLDRIALRSTCSLSEARRDFRQARKRGNVIRPSKDTMRRFDSVYSKHDLMDGP